MNNQDLTQYLFWDGHEQIFNSKRRFVAVKDPEEGITDYLPFKGKFAPRVLGSAPSLDSFVGFTSVPKVGEHLVTFKGFFFGKKYTTNALIREINKDFCFPQDSE